MLKIGITGNIASGKSRIEEFIKKKGYNVIDLDIVVHDLYQENKTVKENILKTFGELDRKVLGQIVFKDIAKRKQLEEIIYPVLEEKIKEFFSNCKDEIIFISGALIYESGFDKYFDKIIFVDSDYETRLNRLIKRNGYSKDEAKKRLDSQNLNFINKADYVIKNNGTLEELELLCNKVIKEMLLLGEVDGI